MKRGPTRLSQRLDRAGDDRFDSRRRTFLHTVGAIGLSALAGCASEPTFPSGKASPSETGTTMYKSSSCECCGRYRDYLDSNGIVVDAQETDDMSAVKERFDVPPDLLSCHTISLEGYFVEGHVPMVAIEQLLDERPDITGVALPGMPAGSPGMGGTKSGAFEIYAVQEDGRVEAFMHV